MLAVDWSFLMPKYYATTNTEALYSTVIFLQATCTEKSNNQYMLLSAREDCWLSSYIIQFSKTLWKVTDECWVMGVNKYVLKLKVYYDYDYGLGIYYRMSIHSSAASKFLPFQAIHEDTTRSLRQEIADLRLRLKDVDALGSQSNDTGSKVRNIYSYSLSKEV